MCGLCGPKSALKQCAWHLKRGQAISPGVPQHSGVAELRGAREVD